MTKSLGTGHPSDQPVFIVGMPKSGTSLVEQILASHSGLFGAGELHDLGRRGHPSAGIRFTEPQFSPENLLREQLEQLLRFPDPFRIRILRQLEPRFRGPGRLVFRPDSIPSSGHSRREPDLRGFSFQRIRFLLLLWRNWILEPSHLPWKLIKPGRS